MLTWFKAFAVAALILGLSAIFAGLVHQTYDADGGSYRNVILFGVALLPVAVGLYCHRKWAAVLFIIACASQVSSILWVALGHPPQNVLQAVPGISVVALCLLPVPLTVRHWRMLR